MSTIYGLYTDRSHILEVHQSRNDIMDDIDAQLVLLLNRMHGKAVMSLPGSLM